MIVEELILKLLRQPMDNEVRCEEAGSDPIDEPADSNIADVEANVFEDDEITTIYFT